VNDADTLLALTGPQTTMVVVISSVIALIVVAVIFKYVSRPVEGYHPPADTGRNEPPVPESRIEEQAQRAEPVRGATKGFVLPPPSDAPAPVGFMPAASTPAAPPAAPPASWQEAAAPSVPSNERTVDISSAVNANVAFDIPAPVAANVSASRSLLLVRSGSRAGEMIRLDSFADGVCAIGRSDVADNQIVIKDDLKVSRLQHAIISREASGRYIIRDNKSANKVYVNDECIDSAPVPLSSGDRIRIGLTEFEFAVEPDV